MATPVQKSLIVENEKYASAFGEVSGKLPLPPAKNYLIVTCMDARIDVARAFGVKLGDAHIIRNAGGNAKDALRSILISQHLLGTREIVLIKHTGCGMLTFKNEDAVAAVRKNGSKIDDSFEFDPFPDLAEGVKADVAYLKGSEGIVQGVNVSGWIYEVETGKVKQVV